MLARNEMEIDVTDGLAIDANGRGMSEEDVQGLANQMVWLSRAVCDLNVSFAKLCLPREDACSS